MAGAALLRQGSDRRRDIVKFVKQFRKKHEYGPTISEIAANVGLGSANATRHHLLKLRDEGIITMEPRIARSIAVVDPAKVEATKLKMARAKRAPKEQRPFAKAS